MKQSVCSGLASPWGGLSAPAWADPQAGGEWATNGVYCDDVGCTVHRHLLKGPPQASAVYTVNQLMEMGIVGYYKPIALADSCIEVQTPPDNQRE
jgi:hypothetical protein